MDFEFLDQKVFSIRRKLKKIGWEFVCSLDVPTYPNLVKEFYGNGKFEAGNFKSMVKGTWNHLNVLSFGQFLRTPTDGSSIDHLNKRRIGLQYILGHKSTDEMEKVSSN